MPVDDDGFLTGNAPLRPGPGDDMPARDWVLRQLIEGVNRLTSGQRINAERMSEIKQDVALTRVELKHLNDMIERRLSALEKKAEDHDSRIRKVEDHDTSATGGWKVITGIIASAGAVAGLVSWLISLATQHH